MTSAGRLRRQPACALAPHARVGFGHRACCALLAAGVGAARRLRARRRRPPPAPAVAIAAEVSERGPTDAPDRAAVAARRRPRLSHGAAGPGHRRPAGGQLPACRPDAGRRREGLIASFRYGLFAPGRSRIVIDLAQPALVSRVEAAARRADGVGPLVDRADARPTGTPSAGPRSRDARPRRPGRSRRPRRARGHASADRDRSRPWRHRSGRRRGRRVHEKDIVFAFARAAARSGSRPRAATGC